MNLAQRVAATQQTIERYKGKSFSWSEGRTCVHMARQHLRHMGHKPPTVPRFRSALAAKRALQERGWGRVSDMFDSLLPRITPAFMMTGDIVVLPGEGGIESVRVCAGPMRFFGWCEDDDAPVVMEIWLDQITAAWRV
jgi:hypothetical protein